MNEDGADKLPSGPPFKTFGSATVGGGADQGRRRVKNVGVDTRDDGEFEQITGVWGRTSSGVQGQTPPPRSWKLSAFGYPTEAFSAFCKLSSRTPNWPNPSAFKLTGFAPVSATTCGKSGDGHVNPMATPRERKDGRVMVCSVFRRRLTRNGRWLDL